MRIKTKFRIVNLFKELDLAVFFPTVMAEVSNNDEVEFMAMVGIVGVSLNFKIEDDGDEN